MAKGGSKLKSSGGGARAVSALQDVIPGVSIIKKNPLPYIAFDNLGWQKKIEEDKGIISVDINSLKTNQKQLFTNRLLYFVNNKTWPKGADIVVVETPSGNVLIDGNHRVVAFKLTGQKKIKAHVYKIK